MHHEVEELPLHVEEDSELVEIGAETADGDVGVGAAVEEGTRTKRKSGCQ